MCLFEPVSAVTNMPPQCHGRHLCAFNNNNDNNIIKKKKRKKKKKVIIIIIIITMFLSESLSAVTNMPPQCHGRHLCAFNNQIYIYI